MVDLSLHCTRPPRLLHIASAGEARGLARVTGGTEGTAGPGTPDANSRASPDSLQSCGCLLPLQMARSLCDTQTECGESTPSCYHSLTPCKCLRDPYRTATTLLCSADGGYMCAHTCVICTARVHTPEPKHSHESRAAA